jgi:chromate transporter
VVLVAAVCGWLVQRGWPGQFAAGSGHGAAKAAIEQRAAWIDDDTPTPEHARYKPSRLALLVVVGALLWLLPMAALVAWQGWNGALAQMGWFFTKAALLTFGGAYAVLPYVYQGAVEHFGWLTAAQMMDGLALGETTPGPLIIVVAFVGFVGGWGQQVLGATESLFWSGAVAAMVVTWFTFLPSFIFILAGGPVVESTHGKLHFTAPLAAISAAVVGVIASLALFFIVHLAQPAGAGSPIDYKALLLATLAAVALLRYKVGIIPVIAACAVAGWLVSLI